MKSNGKTKAVANEKGASKRSISAPSELFDAADALMEERMIDTFSEYVRLLIRRDVSQAKKEAA